MLTPEQRKAREHKLTASVATVVMGGDEAELLRLWREMIGDQEPENLDDVWPVQLGSYLETFVLDWHERKTQHALTERGRVVQHPSLDYVACTLDAFREFDSCTLDAKVCNSWQAIDDIANRYAPQALVQRACRQAQRCALLIMHGTAEPREIEIKTDVTYESEMWSRIASFWMCVECLTPPVPLPKVFLPSQWRTVDLDQDESNWGEAMKPELQQWSDTKAAADCNAHAADAVKQLVPADVGCVRFHNITVKRDRRGYLSIKAA